jgi:hypothetical protein
MNRCRAVGLDAEGGVGVCFHWEAGKAGSVLIITVRATEGDCVATAGCACVISALDAPLVSTSVGISGVEGRADWTGCCSLLAKLARVAKLAPVSAFGDEGS